MKSLYYLVLAVFVLNVAVATAEEIKIGTVNFKKVAEGSKLGKEQQEKFEGLKKQMEKTLSEREAVLTDLENKMSDEDYMDSLSNDKAGELTRKSRGLAREFAQMQQQYMQTLQQTNMQIVQKISEAVAKAAKKVAARLKIKLMLNDEVSFFADPSLDMSNEVQKEMDADFEAEKIESKN